MQTSDVVTQCGYSQLDWLDLGCGTGTLEEKAFREFPSARFTAVDPSEKMLEQAILDRHHHGRLRRGAARGGCKFTASDRCIRNAPEQKHSRKQNML